MISQIFVALLLLTVVHSTAVMHTTERINIPLHGNWCGPGHGGSRKNMIRAIDKLDRICRTHDLCYERYGFANCKCDVDMVKSIRRSNLKGSNRAKAVVMAGALNKSPCFGPVRLNFLCRKCKWFLCWVEPCKKCFSRWPSAGRMKWLVSKYKC